MQFSPSEVLLVLAVALAAGVIMKISRGVKPGSGDKKRGNKTRNPKLNYYLRQAGLVLVVLSMGLLLFGSSALSWAIQSYWVAIGIAVVGLVLMISAKR